jgi:hypothetical protein
MPVVRPDHGASSKGYLVESDNAFPYPVQCASGRIKRSKYGMPTYEEVRKRIRTTPFAAQRRRMVTMKQCSAFDIG